MKLVHTSDWHLGTWLGGIDRRPDLEQAVDALVALAKEVRPDLIIHTGDLFERSLPAGDDVRFAADAMCRLTAIAPVFVLCGNHDGRDTFAGLDRFCSIGGGRLRLLAQLDVHAPLLTWECRGGRIRVGAVPYQPLAAAGFAALASGETTSGAYADRIRQLWGLIGAAFESDRQPGDVDIAAAHLHLSGAVLARSEKAVHVSDDAATDPSALPAVSYAAYGHIHKPQSLPGGVVGRYAGSIIPIDFGEIGEDKGAVVIDAAPGRAARVEFVVLPSGRPLVSVSGNVDELGPLLDGHPRSICRVQVTDKERVEDLAERVAGLLPDGAALHSVVQISQRRQTQVSAGHAEADILTLLEEHALAQYGDAALARQLAALWRAASAGAEHDLTDGALEQLEVVIEGPKAKANSTGGGVGGRAEPPVSTPRRSARRADAAS